MSTIILSYPNTREARLPRIGPILVLSILVLIAITLLVIVVSAKADQAHISSNVIGPIPVATPPAADIQPVPSTTPAPSLDRTSEPVVMPVPVPTPPSQ